MDIRNLSFVRRWRQARPKYGTVNTNHRSFTDTDTHGQPQTQIKTHTHARTNSHTYIKYVFEDSCFYANMKLDMGHITTCFFQRGEDIVLFQSLYSTLSLPLFWDACLPPLFSLLLVDLWQKRHFKAKCCHPPINGKIDLALSFAPCDSFVSPEQLCFYPYFSLHGRTTFI